MKTAIVTGASGGIGREIARQLFKSGYTVFGTYFKNQFFEDGIISVKCDVTNPKDVENLVKTVINQTGRIDVLVNNAGVCKTGVFQSFSEADFDNIINVNLKGTFLMSKAVADTMINQKSGRIINISSIWGVEGASCESVYSASKAGIIGFTKALAGELAPSKITVNSVSPGVILTDMLKEYGEEELEDLKNQTPIGRLGTPKDVANAVMFFAKQESDFITGQNLVVDGLFLN
ncbi:MAG: 3-oxoacyl-ACP reductase FabG [Clostridia bacterium]|nr:3-oxoacyl-ACP reductase FabG [Clostridia bacterium]